MKKTFNICPNCKENNKPSAKFCAYCGDKIKKDARVEEQGSKKFCPKCGRLATGKKFCGYCGTPIENSEIKPTPPVLPNVVEKKDDVKITRNSHSNKVKCPVCTLLTPKTSGKCIYCDSVLPQEDILRKDDGHSEDDKKEPECLASVVSKIEYQKKISEEENEKTVVETNVSKDDAYVTEQNITVCTFCGSDMPLNSAFCAICGKSAHTVSLLNRKKCPSCNETLPIDTKHFCVYCGASLE
ncbi:MAG: zinc ribbon domain-containing protein [Ruminococcaceae bacterium]|nr:zinc ribbon domain-containing protein [Oscillospiraceae bacterium]